MTDNPLKKVGVHGIPPTELAALNQWASDMRKAAPAMQRTANVAKEIHKEMLAAPVWRMVEGQVPADMSRPQKEDPWSIGAPRVNYVDHIDTPGDSHESGDEKGHES